MPGPSAFPVVAERWPESLLPFSCEFGPSRNDFLQVSPSSRQASIIRRGRRLWTCKLTWTRACTDMASLRLWLEALDGYRGTVMLWDFTCPEPLNSAAINITPQVAIQKRLTWIDDTNAERFWSYQVLTTTATKDWTEQGFTSASGAIAAGSMSVPLTALPPNIAKIISAGEYLQIGRRLYIVANDVNSDATGVALVKLTTPLIEPVSNGMEVRIAQAACEMRLDDDGNWKNSRSAGDPFHNVTASFTETAANVAAGGLGYAA